VVSGWNLNQDSLVGVPMGMDGIGLNPELVIRGAWQPTITLSPCEVSFLLRRLQARQSGPIPRSVSRGCQVAQCPGRRKTVTVVLPPPISGATRLYIPTMPETTATFCTPPAL